MTSYLTINSVSGNSLAMTQFLVEAYKRETMPDGRVVLSLSKEFLSFLGEGAPASWDDEKFWLKHLGGLQMEMINQQREAARLTGSKVLALCQFFIASGSSRFLLLHEVRSPLFEKDKEIFRGSLVDLSDLMARLSNAEHAASDYQAANQAITRRISKIGHDLRQLTQICTLHLDSLAQFQSNPGLWESSRSIPNEDPVLMLGRALDNIDKMMVAMLDEFLKPASPQELDASSDKAMAPLALQKENFSLKTLADKLHAELQISISQKNLTLRVKGTPALCHAHLLNAERILRNLLDNAIKFTPSGGSILVVTRTIKGQARVDIVDTGIGIPSEKRDTIWGHRSRGTISEAIPGHGIGLDNARTLVEELGGGIDFISKVGRGTRFWFTLPAPMPPHGSRPLVQPPGDINQARKPYILLIEDSLPVGAMVSHILGKLGCQVQMVGNTESALQMVAHSGVPDVIIADFFLEDGTTGLEAIRRLRYSCTSGIPAILVTSSSDPQVSKEAVGMAVSILRKPTTREALKERLLHVVPYLAQDAAGQLVLMNRIRKMS